MPDYLSEAQTLCEYTRALRRDFHRFPEIGFQEVRTAGIVANELKQLGLEVTTGVGRTGVIALLEGARPGPVVLLRFDMDALPILEETGAEYASQNHGVMHACGHDSHTAVGLTVARLLQAHIKDMPGTVKLVFQPAEEGLGGAKAMVEAGVLADPRPDFALALHVWNDRPTGWIGASDGPVMAASDTFTIRITGKGGHGAAPQQAIDPVIAAAQVISALQTIVSRNIDPLEPAVISVTTLRAGEAHNVIPQYADLKGTLRTFDTSVRQKLLERFDQVTRGVAGALNCQAEIDVKSITPPVINDPVVAARVRQAASAVLPGANLVSGYRTMGSEDMAYMMVDIPGCYFFIGTANAEKGLDYPHHHPRFDIDEDALPSGAALMAEAAVRLLNGS